MPPNQATRNGEEFEQQIGALLDRHLPHCFLPGVPIFRADAAMVFDSMARELDFIVHLKQGRRHTLLIIECKACRVTGKGDGRVTPSGPWVAHYRDGKEKPIKDQLRAQRHALLTNLEPLDGEVVVHALVVAFQPEGLDHEPFAISTQELPSFEMSLVRSDHFEQHLRSLIGAQIPLRVQQSEILRRIRLGQPVPALGHPEIYNAIEYTRRCRAFIDSEIFRHLKFTADRWAINGSAGMGKSVLLIYATMVMITDRFIDCLRDGSRFLQSFTEDAAKVGLIPLEKRRVWVVAHTEKQRDMLERMFLRFSELYGEVDCYNEYRRVKPEFHVFSEISNIDCNVLLIDEAHDLAVIGERRVREWHEGAPGNYLVIACDRHQKLRLSQDETRMINGINFSRCTKKLSRNYRNPFPAYAGSLGLLFRWFTASGPKILPKDTQLMGEFGFGEVLLEREGTWLLRSRNDAHPANNWSHTLSSFPSAEAAYQQLSEFPLDKEHVLWIRFSVEESDFNYEQLQDWSYHSVYGADAPDLLDKYVKGQEFPVVVIEGVPEAFSWSAAASRHPEDTALARIAMWQARRQVYLAASRANVFLYFILPFSTSEDVVREFQAMFKQLAHPPEQESPSGTLWELRVSQTTEVESFESYVDAIEADPVSPPPPTEVTETVNAEPAEVDPHPAASPVVGKDEPASETPLAHIVTASSPSANKSADLATLPPVATIAEVAQVLGVIPPPTSAVTHATHVAAEPKPVTPDNLAALGLTATVADIARVLSMDTSEVIKKLSGQGLRNLGPATLVGVPFAIGVLSGKAQQLSAPPPPPKPPAAPTPKPPTTSHQLPLKLIRHYPSVPKPPVPAPARTPEPAKPPAAGARTEPSAERPIHLSDLASIMHVSKKLVASFLEAEGVNVSGSNPALNPIDVANLINRFCPHLGKEGFNKCYGARIPLRLLANYFGLRPAMVAHDLMEDGVHIGSEDFVPYKSTVRLCFHYRKTLPIPAGKGHS